MEIIIFQVQGSAPEPYTTSFKRLGCNLIAHCTCPAGQVGQYCKHRNNILYGLTAGIISGNESEVQTVLSWLKGSEAERLLEKVREAEAQLEEAKKYLNASKKKLARLLSD